SLKAAGADRDELSMAMATSALLRAGRVFDPEKITSSIDAARMDLCDDSPMTQRNASTRFDFPHPFGPTTPVSPGSIAKSVGSTKDLKPSRRSLVSFITLRPHCLLLLAHSCNLLCRQIGFGGTATLWVVAQGGTRNPPVHQFLHSLIQQAFPGLGRGLAAHLPRGSENQSPRAQGQLPCGRRARFSRPFGYAAARLRAKPRPTGLLPGQKTLISP